MKNAYSKKLQTDLDVAYTAGYYTAEQFTADMFAIAAKNAGVSKRTIIEITKDMMLLTEKYKHALLVTSDPEADVAQEHIDSVLKDIFGNLFIPFEERYEELLKKVRY